MVAPETRVMVKVPSYGEVLEEVKVEVLSHPVWQGRKRSSPGHLQKVWLYLLALRWLLLGEG